MTVWIVFHGDEYEGMCRKCVDSVHGTEAGAAARNAVLEKELSEYEWSEYEEFEVLAPFDTALMLEAGMRESFGDSAVDMHQLLHKMSGGSTIDPAKLVPIQELPRKES